MAEIAPGISVTVLYEGQNITKDISASLISITYSDNTKGKADELTIELDDSDKKWRNEWAPKKKDKISATITVDGQSLDCGTFEIDEKAAKGPPSTIEIRAIANGVKKTIRTKKSKAHEGRTLKQIAQSVCDAHGYTLDVGTPIETEKDNVIADIDKVEEIRTALFSLMDLETTQEQVDGLLSIGPKVGTLVKSLRGKNFTQEADWTQEGWYWQAHHYSKPGMQYYVNRLLQVENLLHARRNEARKTEKKVVDNNLDIVITRKTQFNETDLAFLTRVAAEYGFAFNIKGTHMIFYTLKSLESRAPSIELSEDDLTNYEIKDKISGTFASATVTHHNPKKKEVIKASIVAHDGPLFPLYKSRPTFSPNVSTRESSSSPQQEDYGEDVLEIKSKAETKQQAEAKASSALYAANSNCCSGSFETEIKILCCAGNNVKLIELGEYSGVYHISNATFHIVKDTGGTVNCEIKRVGFVEIKKKRKKKGEV